ncbi:LacI family DNA-binding transcriptional regulator [Weissella hellenica]|uniref:LacI family DNA-binding transcriptional regulator n=1 Tax=Weissella hellenica TaxID=46256 RepID=UPI003885CECB
MASIKEIALISGFSQSTVSRLLNHDPALSVSDATRNKILDTAKKLHYPLPQTDTKKTYQVAVFFALNPQREIEDVYYYDLRRSIVQHAKDEYIDVTFIKDLKNKNLTKFDGAIAVGYFDDDQLIQLHQAFAHILFIDSNPEPEHFSSVQPNLEYATTKAVNLFIKRRLTNIGIVTGQYWDVNTPSHLIVRLDSRLNYFKNIMTDAGLYNDELLFKAHDFTVSSGHEIGTEIANQLKTGLALDALFIASDSLAIGVLDALNEINPELAQTLSIISINDSPSAAYTQPPLTTFHIDIDYLVRVSFNKLYDMITFHNQSQEITLVTPTLVYRDTFTKND